MRSRARAASWWLAGSALVALAAIVHPAGAGSSWQVRSVPEGSGSWVVSPEPALFYFLGAFEGSREWVSDDGGVTGTIRADGPPFPADSVSSFSLSDCCGQQFAVTLDGRLWSGRGDGRTWRRIPHPDSLGALTCATARGDEDVLLGTSGGEIFSAEIGYSAGSGWTRIADLGDAPVRSVVPRRAGRSIVLLDDGRLLAQDTTWIQAPFAASLFQMDGLHNGHAIERGSLGLWRTEDGGLSWSMVSDALASEDLAPWARRARGLTVKRNSFGAISCGDALLATRDGGTTWTVAAEGTDMFLDAAIDDLGTLMTAGARIHRSVDQGGTLLQTMGTDFSRVWMGSRDIYWALDLGLLLSVQQGESWIRLPLPDRARRLRRIAVRRDYEVWLHFDGEEGSRLFHSADRGGTFEELDQEGLLRGCRWWSDSPAGLTWAHSDSAVLRSDDDGARWSILRDGLPGIAAMATLDSLHAIIACNGLLAITHDGGVSWTDADLPSGDAYRALSFAGVDSVVALARGLSLRPADPPWEPAEEREFGDTLRAVRMTENGIGWAVGDGALIAQTFDRGRTWAPYAVDLQINSLETPLTGIHSLDADRAVTGGPLRLIRLLPDATGPLLRYGVSINPQLPRYVDIHVTARERLLGDSLIVTIDGLPVPAALFDPEGFLYRVHFRIPSFGDDLYMLTRASDWLGNVRAEGRTLLGYALDGGGEARATWNGEDLLLAGRPGTTVALLEMGGEAPDPPADWACAGPAFQIAADGGAILVPSSDALRLARYADGAWRIPAGERAAVPDGAVLRLVRGAPDPGPGVEAGDPLRVFPVPASGAWTLAWSGPARAPLQWTLIDCAGRRLASGVAPAAAALSLALRAEDGGGRPLAAGVYWLIAEESGTRAIERLVVVR